MDRCTVIQSSLNYVDIVYCLYETIMFKLFIKYFYNILEIVSSLI